MSLTKKIAAMAAPIAGVVVLLSVAAWAGGEEALVAGAASAQTPPPGETASQTAPKSQVTSKMSAVKHESGSATPSAKAAKTTTDLTTGAK